MNFHQVNLAINLSTVLLFSLVWLGIVIFLRLKKKKSFWYLLVFTVFCVYLYKVLDYTLFQFQFLLLLKNFLPGLMLNGSTAGESLNLIPLATLTAQDLKTSLLNVLLLVPFGFGLSLLGNFRLKKVVIIGALVSVGIELVQLITGYLAQITFRIADINDVIFNTIGAAVGYMLYTAVMRLYRHISRKR